MKSLVLLVKSMNVACISLSLPLFSLPFVFLLCGSLGFVSLKQNESDQETTQNRSVTILS